MNKLLAGTLFLFIIHRTGFMMSAVFGKQHTEVRSHLMHLSDDLETHRFHRNSDTPQNGWEVFLLTSLAYLLQRDTQRDYIRLDQIYPIGQEGCDTSVLPSTPLLILLGRMNS